jgi:arylsulfatase A-like enzyme
LVAALLCAVALVPAASGDPPSQGCDLVASTLGNDSAPGTLTQPFRTVQKLADTLAPGQTGCLRGTAAIEPFLENVTIANKNAVSSTEADRITIRNFPGEIPKLNGRLVIADTANRISIAGLALDGREADGNGTLPSPQIDGDDVKVLDSNLTGGDEVGCLRLGSGLGAIAYRTRIERVRVHDCSEGVRAQYSRNLILLDSLVYDNNSWGLRLGPDADSSFVRRVILDGNQGNAQLTGDAVNYSSGNVLTHNIYSNPASGSANLSSSWNGANTPPRQLNNVRFTCAYAPGQPFSGLSTSAGGYNIRHLTIAPAPDGPRYADRAAKNFHINAQSACWTWMHDIAQTVDDGDGPNVEEANAANQKPNVLFIVTDDQREAGSMDPSVMPDTVTRIRNAGTEFTNAHSTTPQCCPGRTGIFSGRYNHNNGVFDNSATTNFDHSATLQAYLRGTGYRTGLFGKFLNDWDLDDNPPNFDDWSVLTNAGYCPFIVNEQGVRKTYPDGPDMKPVDGDGKCEPEDLGRIADAPYSTDYIADQALSFLDDRESDDDQPWFLDLSPTAPHNPWVPEADYANAAVPTFPSDPSTFESDITDKPSWVAGAQKAPEALFGNPLANPPTAGVYASQLRTLMSVDDMVGSVLDRLEALGEQDTLIVFTSDNGFMWGDHGLINKGFPYTASTKLPFMMRYAPATVPGSTDERLVANIDLAPTAVEAAGFSMPSGTFDGRSLLDPSWSRDRIQTEFSNASGDTFESPGGLPDWAATRTVDYHYIETYQEDGKTIQFREYYDLVEDPYELNNCYGGDGVPSTADDLCTPAQTTTALHDQLLRDRLCQGTACAPGPGSASTTDTQPPRAHLTGPTAGSRVCCRVALTAKASDNFGVTSVEFKVDGNTVGTDTTQPYSVAWDSTGTAPGSHTVSVVAHDSSGNSGGGYADSSAAITLTGSADIQIDNGGATGGKPETGDTITYSFSTAVVPSSIQGGWSGAQPNCAANPTARGCVTVSIIGDGFLDTLDSDRIVIYSDVAGTTPLTSLGSIELNVDDYVSYAPAVRTFTHSPMQMLNGNTALRITLADGTVAATGTEVGTAVWSAPFCGCKVWESVDPADPGPDREF